MHHLNEEKSYMLFFSEIPEITDPFVNGNSQKLKGTDELRFETRKTLTTNLLK